MQGQKTLDSFSDPGSLPTVAERKLNQSEDRVSNFFHFALWLSSQVIWGKTHHADSLFSLS